MRNLASIFDLSRICCSFETKKRVRILKIAKSTQIVKKRFFTFFILVTFYVFNVFLIFTTFL